MNWLSNRVTWGILLILAGVLFLAQTVFFPDQGGLIIAGLFAVVGIFFLAFYFSNRQHWWPLLPGLTLLGLAVLIGGSEISESFGDNWGGSVFLGTLGLAFILVYLVSHGDWWAIIPGGVLMTLALVASPVFSESDGWGSGAIFFLGLGLTFALLGIAPTNERRERQRWAFIPALALLVIGAAISFAAEDLLSWVLPVFLILGGGILLYQALAGRRSS